MTASTYGHIRSFHLPYLREFQERGWETHAACAGIPNEAAYIDRAIEIPFEKRMTALSNLRAVRQLRRLIREESYDLIITHTSLAAFFTRLAAKGMKDRPKLINVMHGYLFDAETLFLKKQLLLSAERLTAPETDLLLTMNEWDFRTAQKYRLGTRIEKIHGMGVDFSRLDRATPEDGKTLRREFDIPKDAFVLLCAAEFSARKSQAVLIRAMTKLPPEAVLVLCGTGSERQRCQELAKRLGVDDRVFFPGYVSDMPSWYRSADAAVSASRSEGLPFNVMEAMHLRLPVIASAVKGHTDLITDGETGLLFPCEDAEMCAYCVQRVMEDRTLADSIREKAGNSVKAYDLREVSPQVLALYLDAAEEKSAILSQKGKEYKRTGQMR